MTDKPSTPDPTPLRDDDAGDFGTDEPTTRDDSVRGNVGRMLTFVGPLLFIGGLLAMMAIARRTGESSIFFAAMMPVGLIMWFVGFYLYATRPEPTGEGRDTKDADFGDDHRDT